MQTGNVETQPERFYHDFVLGLAVEQADRYIITSNRESGLGRYDVVMEPKNRTDNAMIMELKSEIPEKKYPWRILQMLR